VNIAQDIENIDMCENEGDINEEELKDDKMNVRNIFGSIVDFITNKNGLEDNVTTPSEHHNKESVLSAKTKDAKSLSPKTRERKFNLDDHKSGLSQRDGNSGNDIASKVIGFFTMNNNSEQHNDHQEESTPKELEFQSTWNPNLTKDEKLYEIDEESRRECIKMLNYYKSSSVNKNFKKLEKDLPVLIELDSPIPEELSMDYEFAKYDIFGLVPEPSDKVPEYKEVLTKFETLA
jgi:hypothetical protein